MKNNIKQILKDIYMVDPSLKYREKELVRVIEKLLANKPEIEINDQFIHNLKNQLSLHIVVPEEAKRKLEIHAVEEGSKKNSDTSSIDSEHEKFNNLNINIMSKLYYALGGAVVMIAVMFVSFNLGLPKKHEQANKTAFIPGQISQLKDNAFGSLAGIDGVNKDLGAGSASLGMGGGIAPKSASSVARQESGGGGEMNKMIAYPEPVVYKYIYEGELNLTDAQKKVYKKAANNNFIANTSGLIGGFNLGLVDLSRFEGSVLKNLMIGQDVDLGYNVFVDLENSSLSINENGKGWYENIPMETICDDLIGCRTTGGLTLSDIPDDKVLIAMANQFIKDKKINILNYGAPKVDNRWREQYNNTENKGYFYMPENARVAEIKLGDPSVKYISYMHYKDNSYQELFVPSLVFPIINKPKEFYFYRESIVVPLVKDLLQEEIDRPIEPMPLLRGGAAEGEEAGDAGIEEGYVEADDLLPEETEKPLDPMPLLRGGAAEDVDTKILKNQAIPKPVINENN